MPYIERKDIEEMLENAHIVSDGEYCGYCMDDIDLYSIPTADVVEVRRGKWKVVYTNKIATVYECSECNHLTFGTSKYCICGAKMDKKD